MSMTLKMCYNLQEPGAKDMETVRSYMLEYLADGSRSYSEPYFTVSEVIYITRSLFIRLLH